MLLHEGVRRLLQDEHMAEADADGGNHDAPAHHAVGVLDVGKAVRSFERFDVPRFIHVHELHTGARCTSEPGRNLCRSVRACAKPMGETMFQVSHLRIS